MLFRSVLVCALVITLKVHQAPEGPNVAVADGNVPASHQSVLEQLSAEPVVDHFTLSSPISSRSLGPDLSRQLNERAYTHRTSSPPRYVLDRLPVSYEPSFNF